MRAVVLAALSTVLSACATSTSTPWHQTLEAARASICQYCHNSRNPAQFCPTFERAMSGDFAALHSVLADLAYQGQDTSFDEMVPRQLLVVVGDERFSSFVSTQSSADQESVLAAVGPDVDTSKPQETYFAAHYPKTHMLWKSHGQFSEHARERLRRKPVTSSKEH